MVYPDSFELLGPDGPFASAVPGFSVRASQREMAQRIEQALAEPELFIAESGTGTGKTFAYLVPALLCGKKVLISTGTKHLQDQLFQRDLPLVRAALACAPTVALLKGRANYVCIKRLEEAESRRGDSREAGELAYLRTWAGSTKSGDIAEAHEIPEDSAWWPRLTSTPDNCLGARCQHFDACHVNQARRQALKADVIVVNHHLFFADLALREDGFGQLLPGVEAVIFDEAHQLPAIATQFFGTSVSSHQLLELARDSILAEHKEHSAVPELIETAHALERQVAALRLSFGVEPKRAHLRKLSEDHAEIGAAIMALREHLDRLVLLLVRAATVGEELANCQRRAEGFLDKLYLIADGAADHLAWAETTSRHFFLRLTPMNVATPFRQHLDIGAKSWIFTSATLTVGASFTHFQSQLGLEDAASVRWESPFDYAQQSLLYIPAGLPAPNSDTHTRAVVNAARPVLAASRGRAFMLFTSHRALQQAAALLADGLEFPLLIQGQAPRAELLKRFRALGNAVLLGTGSFWEGVDVRGEALSCVIIDKLPFATPDDPVMQARVEALSEAGGNAFMEYQVPLAAIALKQGAGRLIRDRGDRGVLMLCDPRLTTKAYGKIFLASLPPMPRTTALAQVVRFFAAGEVAAAPTANAG